MIIVEKLREIHEDGTKICTGFDSLCKYPDYDCDDCPLILEYMEWCKQYDKED